VHRENAVNFEPVSLVVWDDIDLFGQNERKPKPDFAVNFSPLIMLSSAAKFTSLVPSLSRCLQTAAVARPIPPRRGTRLYYPSVSLRNASADTFDYPVDGYPGAIGSAEDFLKSIGRSAETKVKVEKWDELWKLDGSGLKKQGLDVKDRR